MAAASSSSSSLQRLLGRSLSARVATTIRQLQTPPPPPPPPPLSPLHQPHVADGLPSKIPLLGPLWGSPARAENATRPPVPPPVFPSYPFGLYLGPMIPTGSSAESEEDDAADSIDASAVWADSVKKKRKRKMNKHKYKKLRKRLRRQT